jgi:hypothetical protein
MASCASIYNGLPPTAGVDAPAIERAAHLRSQRGSGVPRQLSRVDRANLREASAKPLRSWAVAALRHVSNSNRLCLGQ